MRLQRLLFLVSLLNTFSILVATIHALNPAEQEPVHQAEGLTGKSGVDQKTKKGRQFHDLYKTNAQRLSVGLPPLPPVRRGNSGHGGGHGQEPPSPPKTSNKPGSCVQGRLSMRDAKTDRHLRYVSFVLDVYTNGQFATGKSKENDLIVCVPTDSKDLFSIKMINGPWSLYQYYGGLNGYTSIEANIGPTNDNFLFLGGVIQTFPNDPPVYGARHGIGQPTQGRMVESAIWTYDSRSGELTPHWVNEDSSRPEAYMVIVDGKTRDAYRYNIALTGNKLGFGRAFAGGSAQFIRLIFVPS